MPENPPSDNEVLALAHRGDTTAQALLPARFTKYLSNVGNNRRHLWQLSDEDIEDAIQNVFLSIIAGKGQTFNAQRGKATSFLIGRMLNEIRRIGRTRRDQIEPEQVFFNRTGNQKIAIEDWPEHVPDHRPLPVAIATERETIRIAIKGEQRRMRVAVLAMFCYDEDLQDAATLVGVSRYRLSRDMAKFLPRARLRLLAAGNAA